MPKVNVIVPVYNVEKYLSIFMESLLNQTFQDFDIWIVNDFSTDNSISILKQYKDKFPEKIHIIENSKNLGLCGARNVGMNACTEKGKFLLLLDSDDYIETTYMEEMVSNAEESSADITICGLERFDDASGKIICREMIHNSEEVIENIESFELLGYINPVVWNKLYRWEIVKGCRFAKIKRSEDTIFLFSILPEIKRIKFVNKVLYHYRIRSSSLTGAITEELYNSMLEGFSEAKETYSHHREYQPFEEMFTVQMFIRCGLGGACRISFTNLRRTHYFVHRTFVFMEKNFPEWRKNKYLSMRNFWKKNYYEKVVSITSLLYKIHMFSFFVYIYYFFSKICKKDVRI